MNEIQTTGTTAISAARSLTREQVDLIKRTCAKEATDDELSLFIAYCNNKGVNPLSKEIYFTKYNNQVNFLTSYHFMLAKIQETGQFEGMTVALFCGSDGVWKDVWLEKSVPVACKVGIYRKGYREAVWSVRYMEESQQANPQWKKQPIQMLRKATIADALRLAFDDVLRGMYTIDEMPTAQFEPTLPPAAPRPTTPWNNKQPLVGEDKDYLAVTDFYLPTVIEGWQKSIIPNWCLPPELQNRSITFEQLATDESIKLATLKKDGMPYTGRWLIHRWQTKKDSPDNLKELATALLTIFPHDDKEESQ